MPVPAATFFSFPVCCSFSLPFYRFPSTAGRTPFFPSRPSHAAAFFSLSLKCPHQPQLLFLSPFSRAPPFFLLSLSPARCPFFLPFFPCAQPLFSLSLEGRGGTRKRRVRVKMQKAPSRGFRCGWRCCRLSAG